MADNQDQIFKDYIELEVFADLNQEVIVTTEDKLKLTLSDYFKKVGKKRDWIAPFSIMITTLTIIIASSFKDLIFTADTWHAIFIIIFLGSLIWLIITLKYAFKDTNIDEIIIELKKNKKAS